MGEGRWGAKEKDREKETPKRTVENRKVSNEGRKKHVE